jgi:hypothetical protein
MEKIKYEIPQIVVFEMNCHQVILSGSENINSGVSSDGGNVARSRQYMFDDEYEDDY